MIKHMKIWQKSYYKLCACGKVGPLLMQNSQYKCFIISFMGNITLYNYVQEQDNINENTQNTTK